MMFLNLVVSATLLGTLLTTTEAAKPGNVIRIPLRQRTSFAGADGTLGRENTVHQRMNAVNRRAADVYQLPDMNLVSSYDWVGNINVGTPPQQYSVNFDTASSLPWFVSASCTTPTCQTFKQRYNSSVSSTSREISALNGSAFTDVVSLGGVNVNMTLVVMNSDDLGDDDLDIGAMPPDGVLPLCIWDTNIALVAWKQNLTDEPVFGVKLSTNDSELHIGGTDSSLYDGPLEYHNVSDTDGFFYLWSLSNTSIYVNDGVVVSNAQVVFDTNTPMIFGPLSDVQKIYGSVNGSSPQEDGSYVYPCTNTPTVELSWGGQKWAISEENFSIEMNSSHCVGSVLPTPSEDDSENKWVVGHSFMKNVYTTFYLSPEDNGSMIGFAALKKP